MRLPGWAVFELDGALDPPADLAAIRTYVESLTRSSAHLTVISGARDACPHLHHLRYASRNLAWRSRGPVREVALDSIVDEATLTGMTIVTSDQLGEVLVTSGQALYLCGWFGLVIDDAPMLPFA